MPWIIDYQIVQEHMQAAGFTCLYHNSGAFGFAEPTGVETVGWIGPNDETIKPAARPLVRQVAEPHEQTLADLATRLWQEQLRGRVWVMPMSHWAYELEFGSPDWMPSLIENVELDPGLLQGRNNAAALEFSADEGKLFHYFIQRLLEMLLGSDFAIVFPGKPILCTLHHHKQLWWTMRSPEIKSALDALVPPM